LSINQETLDERDAQPVSPQTSWLECTPMWITPRLRQTGRHAARGPARHVIDRSRDKELLNRFAEEENQQITEARARLATGRRLRLSELDLLNPIEFDLFLDLLGEALARKMHPNESVETTSSDGALRVHLCPTNDGRSAEVITTHGRFSGADHFITVSHRFEDPEVQEERWDAETTAMATTDAGEISTSGGRG
jgi:uncharacterized protein (TIGR02677 family)